MSYTNYSIAPSSTTVVIDGAVASGVSMSGIPLNIHAIQWNGIRDVGVIEYDVDPITGDLPAPGDFSDPATYQTQIDEALAIIDARENPVIYYFTELTSYEGVNYYPRQSYTSTTVGHPSPPNTVTVAPPAASGGQSAQWTGSAWVLASFDITLSLADAKTSLINTANADGAAAVDAEVGLYSSVQLITAPDVNALLTQTYQPATLGEYQDFIDTNVAKFTNQVNDTATVAGLYDLNPSDVPTDPNPPAISGQLHITRTGLNLTEAFYHTLAGIEAQYIQLRLVATDTTLNTNTLGAYPATPNGFTLGNYNIELIYGFTVIGTFNVTSDGSFMHYDFSYTP